MRYLGIDPGIGSPPGGAVIISDDFVDFTEVLVYKWTTIKDAFEFLDTVFDGSTYAVVEKISWGSKVSKNAGEWIGMLTAMGIPFKEITPKKWQKYFGTFPKERTRRKNELKQIAQQLHPQIKWTHATADAYLLAVYAKEVAWK